jgi:hypothetical protein
MIRTATGKELALQKFYDQLAADAAARPDVYPGTATELARRAKVGRAYLSRVFTCDVSGKNTWKHVLPHLSVNALFQLKQCSAWNGYAALALADLLAVWSSTGVATVEHRHDFGTTQITSRAGLFSSFP